MPRPSSSDRHRSVIVHNCGHRNLRYGGCKDKMRKHVGMRGQCPLSADRKFANLGTVINVSSVL
jgi:hypothetical protein